MPYSGHGTAEFMKKYIYWIGVLAVLGLGILLITNAGLEPHSVPKIKYSQVEHPERFGEAIYQRMRQEVAAASVVMLGVTPDYPEDLQVWNGFLKATAQAGVGYDMVIVEPKLAGIETIPHQLKMDLKQEMNTLIEGIKKAQEQKLRVAIIVPSIYSSQLLAQNPAGILKKDKGLVFTSFNIVKFPFSNDEEENFEPKCAVEKDILGTGPLGCMIHNKATNLYRKKREAGKYSGLMDQSGGSDYLILFRKN